MRAIKSNMSDQILTKDRKILHCPNCNEEFSGNAGDYFMVPEDHIFHCERCDIEMELVKKIVEITYIN